MNDDIKKGTMLLIDGLAADAKKLKDTAADKFIKIKSSLDKDNDGKVDFNEIKDNIFDETKNSVNKISELIKSEQLSEKTKKELNDSLELFKNKVQPALDNAKKELEELKDKLADKKDDLVEDAEELKEKVSKEVKEVIEEGAEEVKECAESLEKPKKTKKSKKEEKEE